MSKSNRRKFIQKALITGAGLSASTRSLPAARTLSPRLLHALAFAVLPTGELGEAASNRTIEAFTRWLARYEPVSEMNHGYFTGTIRYSPEHPGPRWASQLEALDLEAQKRFSRSFPDLDVSERREMISVQIADDRLDRLPATAEARHVAVGLLAFFYAQSETTDLAYETRIQRRHCRPLARAPFPPEPLEES